MSNFTGTNESIPSNLPKLEPGISSPGDRWLETITGQNRTPYSSWAIFLTVIPVSIIIIVIVSGNILVIVAVLWDKRLKSQLQNWLILSLAVADLLVGLLIMPITLAYELLDYWVLGEAMCEMWLAADVLFVTASILNLCAISLDRYWSLTNPVYYATRRTAKRTLLMIACVWVSAFLVCCPLIVGWRARAAEVENQCLLSGDLGYVLYSSCGSFFIPVVILLFVYFQIYRITRSRAQRNLRRTRRRQQMLQHMEDDQEATTAHPEPIQAERSRNSIPAIHFQNGLCDVTSVGTMIGDGLLTVAWNITAISRGSVDGLPILPLAASSTSHWRRCSAGQMTANKKRLRRYPNLSSSVATSAYRIPGPMSAYGQGAYWNANNNEDVLNTTPFIRRRGGAYYKSDSTLSLRPFDLQRQMGRRRKIMRRRERQATSLLGLIVLAFVGCWMPFFCLYLLRAVCCEPPDLLFDIIFWLGYCNSAFNPFIYNFFNPEFRQAFVKILTPRSERQLSMRIS